MAVMGRRSRDIESVAVVGDDEGAVKIEVELEWDALSRTRALMRRYG